MNTTNAITIASLLLLSMGLGAGGYHVWTQEFSGQSVASGPSQDTPADAGKKVLYWKSAMVAGEIHEEAGKDSMGMPLVPVYEGDDVGPGSITIDPTTRQNMGVRLGSVTKGRLVKSVRTVGFVDYDETTLADVTTKVSGWIEKLYVNKTGVQVHRHDKLFDLYSPELFSAQEEYLVALRSVQKAEVASVPRSRLDSQGLVRDSRTRLEYFDVPEAEIKALEKDLTVRKTMTLHAPVTGIVTHKNVVEGQMVKAGDSLMRIADLSKVWVLGKVYEYDLPYVHEGQLALMTLSYLPGRTFKGRVTYVYPYLEKGTREVSVRMEFNNPGYHLKPGMYVTLMLQAELAEAETLVPDVAVIATGTRSVVFVATSEGHYELREVKTGLRSEGNQLQVISGLEPGEKVVVSGQFLLDSESRLREAALKFLAPRKDKIQMPKENPGDGEKTGLGIKSTPKNMDATGSTPAKDPMAVSEDKTFYVCPMPEHASLLYDEPGDCPICGKSMKLVPAPAPTKLGGNESARPRKK